MAKLNSILGDLRGKLGGLVFSRNRFGSFARQKVTPVDPRSQRQGNARSRFSTAAIQWSNTLTDFQRSTWDSYALATPMTDVFGNSINWPGFLWFVRVNTLRSLAGLDLLTSAPSTGGLAIVQNPGLLETITHLFDSNGTITDAFQVDVDALVSEPGWDPDDNGDTLLFFISSQPIPAGQNYFAGPFYHIGSLIGNTAVPPGGPVDFSLDFEPINGTRWAIQFRRIDPTGKTSATYQFFKYGETDSGP